VPVWGRVTSWCLGGDTVQTEEWEAWEQERRGLRYDLSQATGRGGIPQLAGGHACLPLLSHVLEVGKLSVLCQVLVLLSACYRVSGW
jgi:hypothetical protein